MDIGDWREKIDGLDGEIVRLISERARAAQAIGAIKAAAALPVYEPGRESQVFEHVRAINPGPLADEALQQVYERIIDVMRSLQMRKPDAAATEKTGTKEAGNKGTRQHENPGTPGKK